MPGGDQTQEDTLSVLQEVVMDEEEEMIEDKGGWGVKGKRSVSPEFNPYKY